jgi:hypothetical protein
MTLIVEDGTIVADANSYISTTDYIAYALARGVVVAPEDAEVQLIKAMDYLETRVYQGVLVEDDQPLLQPRDYVYINDIEQTYTQIVARMAKAQCELGMGYNAGYDMLAPITRAVKEESFAVFKKVYMDNAVTTPILQKVDTWLDPLLEHSDTYSFMIDRSYG